METKRVINIPDGVDVKIEGANVTVSGPNGKLSRKLWFPGITIIRNESGIVVDTTKLRKEQLAMVGTIAAHIKNMITGATEGYQYKMKILYSHFPIQVKVEGTTVTIGNFLGEKRPRKAKIVGATKVNVGSGEVVVTGIDREETGQTAANIEQTTRIRGFDPRVFQDGIYIIERPGR
ncbi:MAG TPA: 50S ribosomal protein L6 [Candidatus Methanoperedenaceae archaeon]|nr:50S ribosomal protein L6 [Candidatus Methanoperedenaceae archaeon]